MTHIPPKFPQDSPLRTPLFARVAVWQWIRFGYVHRWPLRGFTGFYGLSPSPFALSRRIP